MQTFYLRFKRRTFNVMYHIRPRQQINQEKYF